MLFLLANSVSSTIYATTPAQYSERVKTAGGLIESLIYADDEEMSASEYKNYERQSLAKIRRDIPARERVDWSAASAETDNRWLTGKLDEFEKLPGNSPRRREILTEIGERLAAIGQKLDEIETPAATAESTKNADKQKLAEILRREEYVKPEEQGESFFAKTWRRLKEWLRSLFPKPDIPASNVTTAGFAWFGVVLQWILYALILGVVGFLIYRFAPFFAEKFKQRARVEKAARVILGETLADDATAQNLFAEAERLAQAGNRRGAIRKGYVALLCELNDRKIIGLERHKTNRDYLRDVRKRVDIFENMNPLTVRFERHWYGLETVDENDWNEFKDGYKKVVSL